MDRQPGREHVSENTLTMQRAAPQSQPEEDRCIFKIRKTLKWGERDESECGDKNIMEPRGDSKHRAWRRIKGR